MPDVHTSEQRSYNMSRIRGEWTAPEKKMHSYLKGRRIKHSMHPKIAGNPDIYLPEGSLAVFLDGCFWHGCPTCYQKPRSNKKFWAEKIKRNMANDRAVTKKLRAAGYTVLRFWECELKNDFEKVFSKVVPRI